MPGRDTPPAPLWDGEIWMRLFYLEKRGLSVFVSPLERGLKGCVMERDAAKADGLRDTVSRSLVLQGVISRLQ